MTGTSVITDRARYLLADTVTGASQRWSDTILVQWLNDGGALIVDMAPSSILTAPYTLGTWTNITSATMSTTLSLADRYQESLVDYVCARAYAQDAQDERDLDRSRRHFEQFLIKSGLVNLDAAKGRSA